MQTQTHYARRITPHSVHNSVLELTLPLEWVRAWATESTAHMPRMASYAYLRWRRETEAECGFMVGMGITSPSAWATDHEGTDYGLPPTMCATMRFWFGPQQ